MSCTYITAVVRSLSLAVPCLNALRLLHPFGVCSRDRTVARTLNAYSLAIPHHSVVCNKDTATDGHPVMHSVHRACAFKGSRMHVCATQC